MSLPADKLGIWAVGGWEECISKTSEYKQKLETFIKKVQEQMLEDEQLSAVSDFFKVLGDETRMRIINALSLGELCVSDIAAALEMTQSAVSHQLKLLRMAHQVKARREGKSIYYSLDDQHVIDILDEALTHIRHKINEAD